MQRVTVSVIVPAYNEEKRIKGVLQALLAYDQIDEVICVNDGSTDQSTEIINKIPHVIHIELKKNHGKAFAIAEGIVRAKGEIILFIDGDLKGLTNQTFGLFVQPLKAKQYDAVIGYLSNQYESLVLRPLTGQRSYFREDLLPYISEFRHKGYGLELYLNYLYRNKKVKRVKLPEIRHIWKPKKHHYSQSVRGDMTAARDLIREIMHHENPLHFFYYSYIYIVIGFMYR